MELKKYVTQTMAEAMIKIKNELGDDALIVQTRKLKRGGFFGVGGKSYVEVTAIKDDDKLINTNTSTITHSTFSIEEEIAELKMSIKGVTDKLSEVKMTGLFPEPFENLRTHLIELGMNSQESFSVVSLLSKKMTVNDANEPEKLAFGIREIFDNMIKSEKVIFSPNQKAIFVGPTGVGKTTTIAKIAAKLSLKDKMQLLILSFDTYRIAAAQQLKTYADIIHVPFDVIYTPDQANEIISSVSNRITLVDTAGRSQYDELKISEIDTYVKSIKPNFVFLVIDVTKKRVDVEGVIEHFSSVGVTHLILTKVDETSSIFGPLMAVQKAKIPVCFVTNGQNVPGDLFFGGEFDFEKAVSKEIMRK